MRVLLVLLLALGGLVPAGAEIIWSESRDFYVDPPPGWTFVEDPTPEHFVMTDPKRQVILEIFSQDMGETKDLATKAADLKKRLGAQGDEQTFDWNGNPAWLGQIAFKAGPVQAQGWALVASDGDTWVSALAYTPTKNYQAASDVLISTLNTLALGEEGRRHPGPMSTFFRVTADQPKSETIEIKGLPTKFSMTYDLGIDEAVQSTSERETRILMAQVGTKVTDQAVLAPGWSRFYRQIYREFFTSLEPLSAYWRAQLDQRKVKREDLPQTVLTWLQGFTYSRKGGVTDLSTPWTTLKEAAGDCDSRSLVYLALMEQLGFSGILMVSAPYSHGMAALDLKGQGARFPYEDKQWMVAELTTKVNLGMIASDKADPNQWIGIDLWGKP